jgi:hypothetical protein
MTFAGATYVVGVTSYGTAECGAGEDRSIRTDSNHDWLVEYLATHEGDGACAGNGVCDPSCPDYLDGDPDCAGCENGGACRTDCPALDLDCCAAGDGACGEGCGELDPECEGPADDPGTDDDGAESGGCSIGARDGAFAPVLWALLVAALWLGRRRS